MAITRTAWIDDDGSGTTGTVINNAWKTELYNQIDSATVGVPFRLTNAAIWSTPSGLYTDFLPPGGATAPVWLLVGVAAPIEAYGIPAEADLTQHLLVNAAATPIVFHNQHAAATPSNRLIVPGYGGPYSLQPWHAIWVMYSTWASAWILLKPS